MLDDLRSSPEVLWGAFIAFGIVVLLTPAVGGMARLLGVVDRPGGRRLNKRPIPRLGGLAIFLGILVPSLAFSVYIVYLLEIVKLANPRVRRRRNGEAEDQRLSA
jgi:UDP-N-acetylmuramyl pentapeptide phosphotransferase/UDP-N-acetylglucosamine-1-phosphate transferase